VAAAPSAAKPAPGLTGNGSQGGNSGAQKKNELEAFSAFVKPDRRSFASLLDKIALEDGISGEHEYIVQFIESPVLAYSGGMEGYPATKPGADRSSKGRKGAPAVTATAADASTPIGQKSRLTRPS
jgi:hypothetical protein